MLISRRFTISLDSRPTKNKWKTLNDSLPQGLILATLSSDIYVHNMPKTKSQKCDKQMSYLAYKHKDNNNIFSIHK